MDEATPLVDVFPDNWRALEVFDAMGTQWRVGEMGAVGLDYGVLPAVIRLQGIPRSEWADLFESIRILEGEALSVMRKANG